MEKGNQRVAALMLVMKAVQAQPAVLSIQSYRDPFVDTEWKQTSRTRCIFVDIKRRWRIEPWYATTEIIKGRLSNTK